MLAADIDDIGEEHGQPVLRVTGKGGKVVLGITPTMGGAIDHAIEGLSSGPTLRT